MDHFAEAFNKKSKLGIESINKMIDCTEVQKVYFEDVVKIFLIESFFKPSYLRIVMIIINKIMSDVAG